LPTFPNGEKTSKECHRTQVSLYLNHAKYGCCCWLGTVIRTGMQEGGKWHYRVGVTDKENPGIKGWDK
jgi:hypothetical protein